jgi:hypothetical protein
MEMSCQFHAVATLTTESDPTYQLYIRLRDPLGLDMMAEGTNTAPDRIRK